MVVPIALALLLVVFDLGRGFLAYISVANAARDGARVAMQDDVECSNTDLSTAVTQRRQPVLRHLHGRGRERPLPRHGQPHVHADPAVRHELVLAALHGDGRAALERDDVRDDGVRMTRRRPGHSRPRPAGRRRSRGQSLAEFALAIPLIFLVFLGVAEGGYYVVATTIVSHATHEGARFGVLDSTASRAAVRTRVQHRAAPVVSLATTAITLRLNGVDLQRQLLRRTGAG